MAASGGSPDQGQGPDRPPRAFVLRGQGLDEAPAARPLGQLADAKLFPLVQFRFPGPLGPDNGRYLAPQSSAEETDELDRLVVVLQTVDAPPVRRRGKIRRRWAAWRAKPVTPLPE